MNKPSDFLTWVAFGALLGTHYPITTWKFWVINILWVIFCMICDAVYGSTLIK